MNLRRFISFKHAGKALASGGAVLVGSAITKVIMRIVGHNWPWFVDDGMNDAVDTITCAALAYIGAYLPPPSKELSA